MFVPNDGSPSPAADQVNPDVPSPLALAADDVGPSLHPLAAEFPAARANGRVATVAGPLAGGTVCVPPSIGRDATFVDVAIQELAAQIQHDVSSVAVVQKRLLDQFLAARSYTGRLHVLPDPTRADDVSRTLAWCRRLAQHGQHPILVVTESYIESLIGQFRETLCQASLPVRLVIIPATETSETNGAHPAGVRSNSLLAFLRLLSDTVIISPKDGWELRQMLHFAAGHQGPVVVQVPRGQLPEIRFPDFAEDLDFGKAEILEEGDDVVLLALGPLAGPAVEAAEKLSEQGLSVAVVNARFVQPLDAEVIVRLARRVRGIITLEEVGAHGGFGSAVLELLAAEGISTPVVVGGAGTCAAGEADPPKIVAQIMRSVSALVEHRAQPDLPDWGDTARKAGRSRQPDADVRADVRTFGIPPAALLREQQLVQSKFLSPTVEAWVRAYSAVGNRSRYLWKWCLHGVELTLLPCVLPELAAHVNDTKLLSIILCVVFDDVADQHGNGRLLQAMLRVTREGTVPEMAGLTPREQLVADVTWQLWRDYRGRTETYPFHSVFDQLLQYDLTQFFNTMRYSQLLNDQLPLLNLAEHDLYTSHNMQMISFSTLDLMCSAKFDMEELGRLREAMWHAQCMGRIGNLLCTWRREIPDRDFTSGVFARAVSQGDLTVEQLLQGDPGEIEATILQGEHELYFYRRWLHHRERLRSRARQIRSIELTPTMDGHDRFFLMHLGSRGLI